MSSSLRGRKYPVLHVDSKCCTHKNVVVAKAKNRSAAQTPSPTFKGDLLARTMV